MARKLRIPDAGLLRHVMSRGNGRMQIFLDDGDYRKFQFVLRDVFESHQVECWAICEMPNHYHLVLRNVRPNLSEALRDLNSEYAFWWNVTHRRVGHVFQGRYRDQIVQRESYLLNLLRYVAMNPVRAKLVEEPGAWPWSSYACTAGLRPNPGFVLIDEVLRQFGDDEPHVLRQRYVRHVLAQPGSQDVDIDEFRSRARVLGSPAFRRLILGEQDALHQIVRARLSTGVAIGT